MKTATAPLIALLNGGGPYRFCELYTFTLIDGTVLRYTTADIPITFGGNTFLDGASAPIMSRSALRTAIGVDSDTVTITAYPKASDTVLGIPFPWATRLGVFDGATIRIERAYVETWPTVVGTLVKFVGSVSDAEPSSNQVIFTVKSGLELLAVQMPRNLYQSTCLRTVYDAGCGVNKASFTVTSTVSASPAPTTNFIKTGRAEADGYFNQGVLSFTSGALSGQKRTVKSYAGGAFTFALPLGQAPAVGDAISVYPGCDRTSATCLSKFANQTRFRGFPFIPTPETILG